MSPHKLFTEHPASVGETYLGHLFNAGRFATRMIVGGAACLVHALLPFVFAHTASRIITELHQHMVVARRPASRSIDAPDGSTTASEARPR